MLRSVLHLTASKSLLAAAPLRTLRVSAAWLKDADFQQRQHDRQQWKHRGNGYFGAAACATAAVAGLALATFEVQAEAAESPATQLASPASSYLLAERPPEFPVIKRRVASSTSTSPLKLTLFQFATCPFCCKTRAFLDYYGIDYDIVEVNSVTRKQTRWTPYRKVPLLIAESPPGQLMQLTDSSMIVSALFSFLRDRSKDLLEILEFYPKFQYSDNAGVDRTDVLNKYFIMYSDSKLDKSKEALEIERTWRKWVDDDLVHTLSPNVYRTPKESYESFLWFDAAGDWEKHFSLWERYLVIYVGAAAMWLIGKRLKKRHNLKDDVRESLYDSGRRWIKAVRKSGGRFLGGDRPNLADISVYGVLSAIEGCEAFVDLRAQVNGMGAWYDAVKEAVLSHQGKDSWAKN